MYNAAFETWYLKQYVQRNSEMGPFAPGTLSVMWIGKDIFRGIGFLFVQHTCDSVFCSAILGVTDSCKVELCEMYCFSVEKVLKLT